MITHLCNRCSEICDYNVAEELCDDCLGGLRREYEEKLENEPTAIELSGWIRYHIWAVIFFIFEGGSLPIGAGVTLAVIGLPIVFLVLGLL